MDSAHQIVARATESLCGAVSVEGGHWGWTATSELLLGRPVTLALSELLGHEEQTWLGRPVTLAQRLLFILSS